MLRSKITSEIQGPVFQNVWCTKSLNYCFQQSEWVPKIKSFHANAPYLYPLKTSKNLSFSDTLKESQKDNIDLKWVTEAQINETDHKCWVNAYHFQTQTLNLFLI